MWLSRKDHVVERLVYTLEQLDEQGEGGGSAGLGLALGRRKGPVEGRRGHLEQALVEKLLDETAAVLRSLLNALHLGQFLEDMQKACM